MNINERAKQFAVDAGFPPNTPLFRDFVAQLTEFASLAVAESQTADWSSRLREVKEKVSCELERS